MHKINFRNINILGSISPEEFLRDYWQKKPLLIRQALTDFELPLSTDELAGLALETQVESRLVHLEGSQGAYELENGPFTEEQLTSLPDKNWTLLVQAVDHLIPEVQNFLDAFRFIPSWRLDDLMISLAPEGGGVGPHFDYYDVFLFQASGKRRWQLGQKCDANSPLRTDTQLKILQEFQANPEQDWVLEAGDLLYLPPALAHWGTSLSQDCTTWSVGFRALSGEEILCSAADFIGAQLSEDLRYSDSDLQVPAQPAAIDDAALARVQQMLQQMLQQPAALEEWFGRAMTQTKYPDQLLAPDEPWSSEDLHEVLQASTQPNFVLAEGSRLAFRLSKLEPNNNWLFADGEAFNYAQELHSWVENLCQEREFSVEFLRATLSDGEACQLFLQLLNQGSIYLVEEDNWQQLH